MYIKQIFWHKACNNIVRIFQPILKRNHQIFYMVQIGNQKSIWMVKSFLSYFSL